MSNVLFGLDQNIQIVQIIRDITFLIIYGSVQPLFPVLGLHPGQVAQAARDGCEPKGHDPLVGARVQLKVQGPEHPASLQRSDPVTSSCRLHWLLDIQPLLVHLGHEVIHKMSVPHSIYLYLNFRE